MVERSPRTTLAALLLALTTCHPHEVRAPARALVTWQYELAVAPDGRELRVRARFPAGHYPEPRFENDAGRFASDLELQSASAWRPLPAGPLVCDEDGCLVRYRYHLADAARTFEDPDVAADLGGAFLAPPSTWLIHPANLRPNVYRLRLTSGGDAFFSGLPPAGAPGTYEAHDAGFHESPYFAFGPWRRHTVDVSGARILIGVSPALPASDDASLVRWIEHSAQGLAAYLHGLSARAPLVVVAPWQRRSVYGRTLGGGGGSVLLLTRPGAHPEASDDVWVPLHEMVHLNLPSLGAPHQWLEEGIATNVEPIARARAGEISPDAMWRSWIEMAPNGLPKAGDQGLERTHTWGRTYWGGALFCLLADVEIRARTENRRAFDDVLRAIVASGASVADRWEMSHLLDVGDAATGTQVLHELYARYAMAPGAPDLPALWTKLGVSVRDGAILYDDSAPLTVIRRSITAPQTAGHAPNKAP
jgi:hypothetical protein